MVTQNFKVLALSSVLALVGLVSTVAAASIGAETAAELLAKAQAADSKCHYLQAAEHDELAGLVAKAEVALAAQTDVATTKATMATGRERGRSAACTSDLRAEVDAVLKDAKVASQSSGQTAQATPAAAEPIQQNPVQNTDRIARKPKPEPVVATAIDSPSGLSLDRYAAMTKRYYWARRCNSMPHFSMVSFYHDVVATHYRVVKSFGVRAVAAVMHRSQALAEQQTCG